MKRKRRRTAFKMVTPREDASRIVRLSLFDAMELLWLSGVMNTSQMKAIDILIDKKYPDKKQQQQPVL